VSAGVAFESSESAILARVLRTDGGALSADMARVFLQLDFPPHDRQRMDELAAKSRQGQLSSEEQVELENFCHVGELLGLMQSKARRVLQGTPANS
jgi:hypothetical protein